MKINGNGRRAPRRIPEVLDRQEQERLLSQLEPTDTITKLRNLAMVRIFLNCGLRSAELRALKTRNIDWKTGGVKIRGKGNKERILWLRDDDLLLLKDWLDRRPAGNHLVFTSLDGRKAICARWLRKFVKHLAGKAGIDKDLHVHSLRHSFASDLFRETKNLVLVQQALGHSSINTTVIYTHISNPELEAALKGFRGGG